MDDHIAEQEQEQIAELAQELHYLTRVGFGPGQLAPDAHTLERLLREWDRDWGKAVVNHKVKDAQYPDDLAALHVAAIYGRTDFIRLFIEAGADVTVRDKHGRTPLHWAAHLIKADIAAALMISNGAKAYLDAKDNEGYTALHRAAANNRDIVVGELLRAGADINATVTKGNNRDRTALVLAAMSGNKAAGIAILEFDPFVRFEGRVVKEEIATWEIHDSDRLLIHRRLIAQTPEPLEIQSLVDGAKLNSSIETSAIAESPHASAFLTLLSVVLALFLGYLFSQCVKTWGTKPRTARTPSYPPTPRGEEAEAEP